MGARTGPDLGRTSARVGQQNARGLDALSHVNALVVHHRQQELAGVGVVTRSW